MLENNYPAMVTDLCRLFKYIVLPSIEAKTLEKNLLNDTEEEMYNEVIDGVIFLITQFHNYVSNSFTYQEGSALPNPYSSFAVSLIEPMMYSTSDFIKKATASKLKKFIAVNCINQAKQRKRDKSEGSENIELGSDYFSKQNKKLFVTLEGLKQSNKDEYLLEPASADVEMDENDPSDEDELNKAIEMSLEEAKNEIKTDAVMRKEGGTYVVKQFDIVIDLVTYFKDQIILHAKNNDILKADLNVYMLTKTIKTYGKYRTSLDHEALDPKIND